MHVGGCTPDGFEWIDCSDADQSVIAFLRHGGPRPVLCVYNFTPVPRDGYELGVPVGGDWSELINTAADAYGGGGIGNLGRVTALPRARHGHDQVLSLRLPPLGAVFLAPMADPKDGPASPS